jgi:RNA polymerase sigma-70 factor (ECF subfamily)
MSEMTESASALNASDVAAHAESVRALARRLVRDGGLAEDVAQETWLVAMRSPRRDDVPLSWWLSGVVRNVVRHAQRDDATRRRHELATPSQRDVDAPDALVERTEIHHRLVGAVLALEEPYRATILMRYFEDLSAAEIARRVGVPGATVRSRLKRGLDTLRARLDGDEGGDRRKWALALAPFAWTGKTRSTIPFVATIAACLLLVVTATAVVVRPWNAAAGDDATPDSTKTTAAPAAPANAHRGAEDRTRRARSASTETDVVADAPTPSPAPAEASPVADGATGVSIEVVDENGVRVREGTVKLDIANLLQLVDFDGDAFTKFMDHLGEKPLAGGNPVTLRDLPKEMDGLDVAAFARVPGLPPTETAKFTVHAGRVEPVRLVAAKPQTASVVVVDRTTDLPIANAAVVSATELHRRAVEPAAVRGTTAAGSAVTSPDGRCALEALGRGEHEIEVDAKGYLRAKATWTADELRVRMAPQCGGATVTVQVFGPDGTPLPEMGVKLFNTDRGARTDAGGRAVFADVAPGFVAFSLDMKDWVRARVDFKWKATNESPTASVTAEAGGSYELALGFVRGTATLDGRLVDESGAPVVGVGVGFAWGDGGRTKSDDSGAARFVGVKPGKYMPHVDLGLHETWFFDDIEVADGAHLAATWTVGTATIRGRVVAGADAHGVAGIDVYVGGPAHGIVRTGDDGRFAFHRARAGTYEVEAKSDQAGARLHGVAVPRDAEVVLAMATLGRVAVRFTASDRPQLREATVSVFTAEGENSGECTPSGGDEDLASPGFIPGKYEVEVAHDGRKRRFPVEVKSGETSVVVVSAP